MSDGFTGGCLCGAVRYESTQGPILSGHCHCLDCRRSSGTGHCTHVVVSEEGFSSTGEVTYYERPADSGNRVSRGFCPTCGAAVFSRNSGNPDMIFPRASSLDDPNIISPQLIVYASRAAAWDHMDPSLPAFAEMPDANPLAGEHG